MKVTKQETLYHEDYGATLKHKCGKKDSNIVPSLFFSHPPFLGLLSFLSFFWPLFFFFVWSLIPTGGGIIVSIILSSMGQCSNNDDHHTFIYLQLNITTRYLEQRYDSM